MSYPVELYIYDLAQGMASQFSGFVGFQLDGIWHTSIVVHNLEIFFGSGGVEQTSPGGTMLGRPLRVERLGTTRLDINALADYLNGLGRDEFHGSKYQLLQHNCNNFSNVVAQFLTGRSIPDYILELPRKVMNSPIAAMLAPIIENATPRGQSFAREHPAHAPAEQPSQPKSAFSGTELVKFDQRIDVDRMRPKFSALVQQHKATPEEFSAIIRLAEAAQPRLDDSSWASMKRILTEWPQDSIYPVLDALRWSSLSPSLSPNLVKDILATVAKLLSPTAPNNCIQLSAKTLCNLSAHSPAQLVSGREDLVGRVNSVCEELFGEPDAAVPSVVQIGLASLLLNLTVLALRQSSADSDALEAGFQLVSSLSTELVAQVTSGEAQYRAIVALEMLCAGRGGEVRDLALGLDLPKILRGLRVAAEQKEKVEMARKACLGLLEA